MAAHDDVKAASGDRPAPDWSSTGPEMQADPLRTLAHLRTHAPVPYSDAGRLGLAGDVTFEAWHRFGPRSLPDWIEQAE